jgi:addiction module RelE/StbE family toxin
MTSSSKRKIQKTKRFSKDIKRLPSHVQKSAFDISIELSENIVSPKLKIKKLTGFEDIYRVVVIKDYRMIFSYDKDNIYLLRIGHRKEIYRKFEI